jgi:hypothetical protein
MSHVQALLLIPHSLTCFSAFDKTLNACRSISTSSLLTAQGSRSNPKH